MVIHLSGSMKANPSPLQRISSMLAVSSGSGGGDPIIRIDRLDVFSKGGSVKVVQEPLSYTECKEVLLRAYSKYKVFGYSLVENNCEHFCNWCFGKKQKSKQVENWMVGLTFGAIAGTFFNPVIGGAAFAAGIAGSYLVRSSQEDTNAEEEVIYRTKFLIDAAALLLAGKAKCHGDDMLQEMGWLVEIFLHDENNEALSFVKFQNQSSGSEQILRFGTTGEGCVIVNSPVLDSVFSNVNGFLSHLGFSEELSVKVAAEVTQGIARLRTASMVSSEREGEGQYNPIEHKEPGTFAT